MLDYFHFCLLYICFIEEIIISKSVIIKIQCFFSILLPHIGEKVNFWYCVAIIDGNKDLVFFTFGPSRIPVNPCANKSSVEGRDTRRFL